MNYIEMIKQRPVKPGFEGLSEAAHNLHNEALAGVVLWDGIEVRLGVLESRLRKHFPENYGGIK